MKQKKRKLKKNQRKPLNQKRQTETPGKRNNGDIEQPKTKR